jgi:hypothetical protein
MPNYTFWDRVFTHSVPKADGRRDRRAGLALSSDRSYLRFFHHELLRRNDSA